MKIIEKLKSVLLQSFLWIYFVVSLYPLMYMLFFSLKNNEEIFFTNPLGLPNPIRFGNYLNAVTSFDILKFFRNSTIVAIFSIIFIVIFSLMFSYAVARMTWRFRETAKKYMLLGLFIPMQVIMIPLAVLVKQLGFANSHLALIIPYIAFNLSFSSLIFYAFLRTIPIEMEESAFLDGATIYRSFLQIIVPLIKPALATVTIFSFLNVWNEYTMALILVRNQELKTLPIGLLSFAGQFSTEWGPMGAAMILASIPMIIVYLIMGEQIENALTIGGAVKG